MSTTFWPSALDRVRVCCVLSRLLSDLLFRIHPDPFRPDEARSSGLHQALWRGDNGLAHLMDAPDHHEATPILKIFIPVQGGNDALFPLE